MQPLVVQPKRNSVVLENHSLPRVFNYHIIRSGARLLMRIGPSAITRLVMPMRVNAVKRMPRRAWPHVSQEQAGIVYPCIAHTYSAPAVLRVLSVVRVLATRFSVVIRLQFAAFPAACAVPVLERSGGRYLLQKTSTGLRESSRHRIKFYYFFCSTYTREPPVCMSAVDGLTMHCREAAKCLSSYF